MSQKVLYERLNYVVINGDLRRIDRSSVRIARGRRYDVYRTPDKKIDRIVEFSGDLFSKMKQVFFPDKDNGSFNNYNGEREILERIAQDAKIREFHDYDPVPFELSLRSNDEATPNSAK